ncbi:MAG TPA: beta-ketoacyl synthase N-terminal-like domain-containing protein [Nitrospirota bacterium]|nr:beta-ketoacyl synthase N-terminal-like domain-containing protein [Nitrospirota bacterium]
MNVLGIGTVFAGGIGIKNFEEAMVSGWQTPIDVEAKWAIRGKHPVYQANLDDVPDKTILKKIRRADRLSKMAVLCAADAIKDSGIGNINGEKVGIIVATAFGAHVTTFGFLDNILDFGETAVSPTIFSNSVHNAAASYVSSTLDIKGPTLTITQFRFSFQLALQLAVTWLQQQRCDYVLAGAVDQLGDVLCYIADRKLTTARDGRIRPFVFKPTCQVPGEGAIFYILGREKREKTYCTVQSVMINDSTSQGAGTDVTIIDADGMLPDESAYLACADSGTMLAAYSPLFGTMMTGSAFNVAAGALMLNKQRYYPNPVQDNPRGLRILTDSGPAHIASIECVGYDCHSTRAAVRLIAI